MSLHGKLITRLSYSKNCVIPLPTCYIRHYKGFIYIHLGTVHRLQKDPHHVICAVKSGSAQTVSLQQLPFYDITFPFGREVH